MFDKITKHMYNNNMMNNKNANKACTKEKGRVLEEQSNPYIKDLRIHK